MLRTILATILASLLCTAAAAQKAALREPYPINPPSYTCYRTMGQPVIDGDIGGPEWDAARWTSDFVDIQGTRRPETPRFRCRAKLMWSNEYLYIAAELEEPHLWGTLTERESVIFHDNDFEVFLDPTGTGEHYTELEINALGTVWDLMLTKAYKNGGRPLNAWNHNGMLGAVKHYGTLNDPSDTDTRWTVELALPLRNLTEIRGLGRHPLPRNGETWRMNFSRVQWQLDIAGGKYAKRLHTPEDNWVWAPTGIISIHEPEYWGYLIFSTDTLPGATDTR